MYLLILRIIFYNKIIFDVEQIVNYYLQKFSDFVIELKGTKLLADGKLKGMKLMLH